MEVFYFELNVLLLSVTQKQEEEKKKSDQDKLSLQDELETLKKEQEDLLVLLADQDTKIDKFKARLKELGQEVGYTLILKRQLLVTRSQGQV